ncbi:Piwi domain-containing protein [Gracilimonas sp.]|uniref:Piwi domain-containing protein n=1 Tax=Gracilimonas sp. TaxID=1974203 RepID=UPI0032EBC703
MASTKILTNFFPIELFPPKELKLKLFPYSLALLRELRDKHNDTHSFFRTGDYIYGSWMKGDQIEGETVIVDTENSPEIVSSLIKHIFFRAFLENTDDIVPLSFYPFSFVSPLDLHDAVREFLPDNLKGIITYDRQFEIDLRTINGVKKQLKYGFTINISHLWNVSENILELMNKGINLIGFDIIHARPLPGKKGILAPQETLLGSLTKVENRTAFIDTNEGEVQINAEQCFIRRSTVSIKKLLVELLSENQADQIVNKAKVNSRLKSDYKQYYTKLYKVVSKRLSNWRYHSLDGFEYVLSENSELPHNNYSLEENKFIFDYGTGSANTSIIKGLSEFGPFDSTSFTPKTPNILVICKPESRGGFSKTMGMLGGGMPDSKYYRRGMKDLFRLQDINFDVGEIQEDNYEGYLKIIKEKLAGNKSYDLVVVEGTNRDAYKDQKNNPYYRVKAFLLSQGIPVQALQENRTRNTNGLEYILAPLALQMYSKMGGIPWVLPSSNDVDWEIIVGVSHTYLRSSHYKGGDSKRIVGLTTFFSSDGNLLFSDNSKATDYDNFFDELLLSLKSSVNKLSEDMAWKKGQTVRFVFHVFKPMKNTELQVVQELVNSFEDFSIQFAFVQIVDNHPFLLFDKKSPGSRGRSKVNKDFVPLRGTNLIINDNECLLTTMGAHEIKFKGHAPSRPVLIKLHEESTFKDMHHITQQVYKFSHHSWRSLNPNHTPVTLFYAKMISKLLGQFKGIPDFSSAALLTAMKRKKWFL